MDDNSTRHSSFQLRFNARSMGLKFISEGQLP